MKLQATQTTALDYACIRQLDDQTEKHERGYKSVASTIKEQ